MTPAEYLATFESLPTPTTNHDLEAHEVAAGSGVWVGRGNGDHQHLLVKVGDAHDLDVEETHGLQVRIGRHRIAGRDDAPYIDLVCLDAGAVATFAAVASEIAAATVAVALEDRPAAVAGAVRAWRWFWGVDPSRMSTTDAIGIFGELWFLNRWAGVSEASVEAWEGSHGSRHDFQWPSSSVEIKTKASAEAIVHNIENLEQLDDPETGELYLFSLRISRDPLAANSVNSLATATIRRLQGEPAASAAVLEKLASRGYTPAGREASAVTYRVLDEALYRVAGDFPRLTRSSFPYGLPQGITTVAYQLDMNACGQWRVDVDPTSWAP